MHVEVHLNTIARLSDRAVAVLIPLSARSCVLQQDTSFSEHNTGFTRKKRSSMTEICVDMGVIQKTYRHLHTA